MSFTTPSPTSLLYIYILLIHPHTPPPKPFSLQNRSKASKIDSTIFTKPSKEKKAEQSPPRYAIRRYPTSTDSKAKRNTLQIALTKEISIKLPQ